MLLPTVLWAQRKDKLYLTVDVQDVQEPQLKLVNDEANKCGKLTFTGKAGSDQQEYSLDLTFYDEIDEADSKVSISPRHIFIVVMKKGESEEHWPRLTKDSMKGMKHIKCDWDKWIDEDDEEEGKDNFDLNAVQGMQGLEGLAGGDMSGFGGLGGLGGLGAGGLGDLAGLGGLGGMGGEGGEADEDDSDDEDLPDLEK